MMFRLMPERSSVSMIGGVCAGLSYMTGFDLLLIRIITLASLMFGGWVLLVYVLIWWFAPVYDEVPEDFYNDR